MWCRDHYYIQNVEKDLITSIKFSVEFWTLGFQRVGTVSRCSDYYILVKFERCHTPHEWGTEKAAGQWNGNKIRLSLSFHYDSIRICIFRYSSPVLFLFVVARGASSHSSSCRNDSCLRQSSRSAKALQRCKGAASGDVSNLRL